MKKIILIPPCFSYGDSFSVISMAYYLLNHYEQVYFFVGETNWPLKDYYDEYFKYGKINKAIAVITDPKLLISNGEYGEYHICNTYTHGWNEPRWDYYDKDKLDKEFYFNTIGNLYTKNMKLISHRGNMVGPNPSRENTPSYIDTAISAGYEVEVDINYVDGNFYLGHDTPDIEITRIWMEKRKDKIWFHCKNLDAATQLNGNYKFFCHTSDSFVLTSTNHVWVHDLSMNLNNKCIIPLLNESAIINKINGVDVYAVCTDYINLALHLNGDIVKTHYNG